MSIVDNQKNRLIPSIFPIVCIGLLLAALCKLPYGYYTLLRLTLFVWGIIYGIKHYSVCKNSFLTTLSFGVSVLYNPIIIVHLDRQHWTIINIITILIVYICSIEIKQCIQTVKDFFSEKNDDISIATKNEREQTSLNISQLVNKYLNIQVNGKQLFKTTPEKIEALYYMMFMIKKALELNHGISKNDLCILHLTAILTELKVRHQDIDPLIKIWLQDRIETYSKSKLTEWDQTLNHLCIWAQHHGHTNATINNVPRIDHNNTTNKAGQTIHIKELDDWINILIHANFYRLVAKKILSYEK